MPVLMLILMHVSMLVLSCRSPCWFLLSHAISRTGSHASIPMLISPLIPLPLPEFGLQVKKSVLTSLYRHNNQFLICQIIPVYSNSNLALLIS